MTAFLAIGALLVAVALSFVLWPLLQRGTRAPISRGVLNTAVYRDQILELENDLRAGTLSPEQHDKARRELEARLLDDVNVEDDTQAARTGRGAAVAVALAVPLLAVALYLLVGNPQALDPKATAAAKGPTPGEIKAMVERLAGRLEANPEDAEGWVMLGRSYAVLGRFDEASRAYANAVERLPNNAHVLVDYAEAVAMAQGQTLDGEPEKFSHAR